MKKILEMVNRLSWSSYGIGITPTSSIRQFAVASYLVAEKLKSWLDDKNLILEEYKKPMFKDHNKGKDLIVNWAKEMKLDYKKEIDIGVETADVLLYADDIGIFEVGTIPPLRLFLLLKMVIKMDKPMSLHFWPYFDKNAYVFKNWY